MNITIFTDLLPYPLNSGGAQAQFNFIDELRHRHHITIAFAECGRNSVKAMRQLQQIWTDVDFEYYSYRRQLCHWQFLRDKAVRAIKLKTMAHAPSFLVERALKPYAISYHTDFVAWINDVVRRSKADLVQADLFPMLPVARFIEARVPKVFVHHEIRFVRNERLLNGISLSDKQKKLMDKVKAQEIADLNQYDAVVTLTEQDKLVLTANSVHVPIHVSPAAVNSPVIPYKHGAGRLVYLGGHRHIPNKEGVDWFSENVLPLLDNNAQEAIDIVGAGWPERYSTDYGYNLRGFVDNLADALCGNILFVPLLTGSGMRMKILDAAAIGVPFITTSVGIEGLDFQNGESCIIADTPRDFADGINSLLADDTLRERMARNAQRVYKEKYSVEALSAIREQVYVAATNRKSTAL